MKNRKNNDLKKEQTPIMDGDARPDKLIEPEIKPKSKKPEEDNRKVTSGRSGDINTLEDFKDAK
jgi:hypothetical protein